MNADEQDRPWCAVCEKSVDLVTTHEAPERDAFVYIVECHGERERAEVYRIEITYGFKMTFGRAFEQSAARRLAP